MNTKHTEIERACMDPSKAFIYQAALYQKDWIGDQLLYGVIGKTFLPVADCILGWGKGRIFKGWLIPKQLRGVSLVSTCTHVDLGAQEMKNTMFNDLSRHRCQYTYVSCSWTSLPKQLYSML